MANVVSQAQDSFTERAKPFMHLDCYLLRCVFPDCIGKSGICNSRAEAFASFFATHDRQMGELRAEIIALQRENARMRGAVKEARDVFRHYGDLHAAKPDLAKADRNYNLASRMNAVICGVDIFALPSSAATPPDAKADGEE